MRSRFLIFLFYCPPIYCFYLFIIFVCVGREGAILHFSKTNQTMPCFFFLHRRTPVYSPPETWMRPCAFLHVTVRLKESISSINKFHPPHPVHFSLLSFINATIDELIWASAGRWLCRPKNSGSLLYNWGGRGGERELSAIVHIPHAVKVTTHWKKCPRKKMIRLRICHAAGDSLNAPVKTKRWARSYLHQLGMK